MNRRPHQYQIGKPPVVVNAGPPITVACQCGKCGGELFQTTVRTVPGTKRYKPGHKPRYIRKKKSSTRKEN